MKALMASLAHAGETGRQIRDLDWAKTELGAMPSWTAPLKNAASLILQSNVAMLLLWGEHGVAIHNDAYARTRGRHHPDLLGHKVKERWLGDRIVSENVMRKVLSGQRLRYSREETVRGPGGKPRHVRFDLDCSPVLGEGGDPEGMLATVVETTERTEAEGRLLSLINGIPQLVWRSDNDGYWTWSSPQWQRYTGQSAEQSQGQGWLKAVHPDDRLAVRRAWAQAMREQSFGVECRIHNAGGNGHCWFQSRAAPAYDKNGDVVEWLGTSTDVHELRQLQEHQKLLLQELRHRVRNTLSVIRAISRRTAEASSDVEDYAMHFDGRLEAFARTQAMVTHDPVGGLDLETLVLDELQSYGGRDGRFAVEGPPVKLRAQPGETLALAIHELATNAMKYGALSQPYGHIAVRWSKERLDRSDRLVFRWAETGVELKEARPAASGFGFELLERTLAYEMDAETTITFVDDGLRCEIALPWNDVVI